MNDVSKREASNLLDWSANPFRIPLTKVPNQYHAMVYQDEYGDYVYQDEFQDTKLAKKISDKLQSFYEVSRKIAGGAQGDS